MGKRDHDDVDTTPVLELRIHGISNTPPASMLDLPPGDVVQARGDTLGSFWVPSPDAQKAGRALPPDDRHAIRPDVRREAYSWGATARLAGFPGGALLNTLGRALVRAFWVLALPFGLVNVAYWTRRVRTGRDDVGAGPVAVFSLGLTLLVVASAATVALDLVGTQCFGPKIPLSEGGTPRVALVCTELPPILRGLARFEDGPRLALLSLVPVAVALVAALVAANGKARFDDRVSSSRAVGMHRHPLRPTTPELAADGFWSRRTLAGRAIVGHLAAALAFVALLLAWDGLFGAVPACIDLSTFVTTSCWDHVWAPGASAVRFGVLAAVAAADLLLVTVLLVGEARARDGVTDERKAPSGAFVGLAVVVAVAVYAASALVVAVQHTGHGARFAGLVAAPGLLVVLLLAIGVAALGWRGGAGSRWLVLPAAAGALGLVQLLWGHVADAPGAVRYGWAAAAVCVAVLLGRVAVALWGSPATRFEGWRGGGPGVFLILSAAVSMVFSSLVVLGTLAYLRRNLATAAFTLGSGQKALVPPDLDATRDYVVVDPVLHDTLVPPSAYAEFAVGAVAIVVLLAVLALALLWPVVRDLVWHNRPLIPGAPNTVVDPDVDGGGPLLDQLTDLQAAPDGDKIAPTSVHRSPRREPAIPAETTVSMAEPSTPPAVVRVLAARHVAAFAQRAEIVVGLLALSSGVVLSLTILARTSGPGRSSWVLPDWLLAWSVPAVGAVALALTASMVAGASEGLTRPWGLLWDLICFLPRAAHPFGPPSYADRVVPEVRARVEAWLAADDVQDRDERAKVAPGRLVVLSAHSLGGVIATAVVLARHEADRPGVDATHETDATGEADAARGDRRVGLLTYGTQVRAYFGRFFPELLGVAATGTTPCTAPRLLRGDPWAYESAHPPVSRIGPDTLVDRLAKDAQGRPAWINLWRRTDFIGMPVVGYGDNPVDRGAEEVDRTQYLFELARHSSYERSYAYHRALGDVIGRLRADG